jgi:predicted nucleic acid-binding protein
MKIVADSNTYLAVALNEPERRPLINITAGHELVAPQVLPFEIGNALIGMSKKGALRASEVDAAWQAVQAISVELREIDARAALAIAVQYGIYAYDAYFLECAVSQRAPLLTLDKGMKRIAREMRIHLLELET